MRKAYENGSGCGGADAESMREGAERGRHARRGGTRKACEKGAGAEGTREGTERGTHARAGIVLDYIVYV
jgi:hypothetical protein